MENAGSYSAFFSGDEMSFEPVYIERGEFQRDVLPKVARFLELEKSRGARRLLDLGCGTGRHSLYAANLGFEVTAVDLSAAALAILQHKLTQSPQDVQVHIHDIRRVPFADASFDSVLCVWTLGHGLFVDTALAIEEVARVLKPGGGFCSDFMSRADETYGTGTEIEPDTFIGSVDGEEHIPHHYFEANELERLFECYTRVTIEPVKYSVKTKHGIPHLIDAFDVVAMR